MFLKVNRVSPFRTTSPARDWTNFSGRTTLIFGPISAEGKWVLSSCSTHENRIGVGAWIAYHLNTVLDSIALVDPVSYFRKRADWGTGFPVVRFSWTVHPIRLRFGSLLGRKVDTRKCGRFFFFLNLFMDWPVSYSTSGYVMDVLVLGDLKA